MPYIDLHDTQLYYDIDDYTDPWRTPQSVLMIHGFTESTPAWLRWVPGLARDYRVIRYDQVGFGQSAPVENENAFSTQRVVEHAAQ